jgi:hypothetical protein
VAVVAVAALVAAVAIAVALLGSGEQERIAAPGPTRSTAAPPSGPEAALRRLDGMYVAKITPATISRMGTLENSILTLRRMRGGCSPVWTLITSTPWHKA